MVAPPIALAPGQHHNLRQIRTYEERSPRNGEECRDLLRRLGRETKVIRAANSDTEIFAEYLRRKAQAGGELSYSSFASDVRQNGRNPKKWASLGGDQFAARSKIMEALRRSEQMQRSMSKPT